MIAPTLPAQTMSRGPVNALYGRGPRTMNEIGFMALANVPLCGAQRRPEYEAIRTNSI
ncbi:hypothetical protein GR212_35215 [Rhizobium lusitanum]|uniref:Uncharacterized protein n=1 Tax=Rhizobium lusitanum TaxID=293958 RepID=A0A6L9UGQ2_9HYPH|nr:hypothetical protein [Rhizobium lusitanum]NEI74794.1 hypothetical protein [Rhizobium lusitanum]